MIRNWMRMKEEGKSEKEREGESSRAKWRTRVKWPNYFGNDFGPELVGRRLKDACEWYERERERGRGW
jgi:hypothetical protein